MTTNRTGRGFLEVPHAAVYLLLTATMVTSGLCLTQSGTSAPSAQLLFRYGAMYSGALEWHEYWRLIAYGFLHVNFLHLATNMLCLVLWGGHLEKRVGSLYFLIVYFSAMVFGAVVGDAIHSTEYLTVGASGATSGVLGALLCLWILGKINLRADFFAINIGLNIAFAISNPRIDWGVHLGGFVAGLIVCAVLDLIEKLNSRTLRCKFPEFVKVNVAMLFGGTALWLWAARPPATGEAFELGATIAYATTCLLVVKLIDIALSVKKGLAIVVVVLATANAALVFLGGWALTPLLSTACTAHQPNGTSPIERLFGIACSDPVLTITLAPVAAVALTLLVCSKELYRGIEDVGFVGASLRAERNRRQGI